MSDPSQTMRLYCTRLENSGGKSCLEVSDNGRGLAVIYFNPVKQRWYGHLALYDGLAEGAEAAEFNFHLTHISDGDAEAIAQRYLQNIGGRRA